eukprot:m.53702 g.53702  ORF g.53702 m.53702 type:complete len:579 (-) comp7680_c0_seq1:432-2168(-)
MMSENSFPGGWRSIAVDDETVFIHELARVASLKKEEAEKKKPRRNTKVSTESGTYVIQPHPKDLPPMWERAVALNPDGSTGVFVYHNIQNGQTSMSKPIPDVEEGEEVLPAGWVVGYDEDGDIIFEDKNSGIRTYDDPRFVSKYVRSSHAEEVASTQLRANRTDLDIEIKKHLTTKENGWRIGAVDHASFNSIPQHLTSKSQLPAAVVTKALNRYTNILPNPRTRVRIEDHYEPKSAISMYINANFIPGFDLEPRSYIAAMGPLDNTIEAFWRMTWMVNSPAIIMTTPMAEKGMVKCARYWPTVRYNAEKKCGDKKWGDFRVAVLKGQKRKGYIITHLRLTKGKDVRFLRHYWFTDWPDHGVPRSAMNVIDMLADARRYIEKESKATGPMIVHCSAGIGRTGTFIAIDHCIRQLEASGRTEPLEVVSALRRARGGMVQHPQQYEFVQRACIEYALSKDTLFTLMRIGEDEEEKKSTEGGDDDDKKSKKINWKNSMKSKQAKVLEELIDNGKPDEMPESDWKKVIRRYCKQQSTIRAKHSMRRKFDPEEMDGELRLGTLSGGTALLATRPSAKELFEEK